MSRQCLVIAGEKSGEEHFLTFMPAIKEKCPDIHFWGVGGDEMKSSGVELLYHLSDFSSWGYTEVLSKIPFYLSALKRIEEECVRRKTQVAILIDFQEFNMKLAKRLKKRGIKVMYYVAPQAWAWKAWRARAISQSVHSLFVILPFEKNWFESRGVERVVSVNHPLWKTYRSYFPQITAQVERESTTPLQLLLLPGSRKSELKHLLPEFSEAIKLLKKKFSFEVSLVRARHLDLTLYDAIIDQVDFLYEDDQLPAALLNSDFALAASGTVTLSCALFAVPTVVTYRTSLFNSFLYHSFVDYKGHVSLANLVHGKELFPELIDEQSSAYNMAECLSLWMEHSEVRNHLRHELLKTQSLIGGEMQTVGEYIGEIVKL